MNIVTSMRGEAYALVHDIPSGAGPEIPEGRVRPHDELLDDYEDRFLPDEDREDACTTFLSATQQPGESNVTWYCRIEDLSSRMIRRSAEAPDEGDAVMLRHQFIEGLADPFIKAQVLSDPPGTWARCLKAVQRAEFVQADRARYQPINPEHAWRGQLHQWLPGHDLHPAQPIPRFYTRGGAELTLVEQEDQ